MAYMSGDRDYLYGEQPWHADPAARGRKKTVRFDSVADPSRSYGQAELGPGPPDYGWMTIQDLRGGRGRGGPVGGAGGGAGAPRPPPLGQTGVSGQPGQVSSHLMLPTPVVLTQDYKESIS